MATNKGRKHTLMDWFQNSEHHAVILLRRVTPAFCLRKVPSERDWETAVSVGDQLEG
jgi:hypothetical protein